MSEDWRMIWLNSLKVVTYCYLICTQARLKLYWNSHRKSDWWWQHITKETREIFSTKTGCQQRTTIKRKQWDGLLIDYYKWSTTQSKSYHMTPIWKVILLMISLFLLFKIILYCWKNLQTCVPHWLIFIYYQPNNKLLLLKLEWKFENNRLWD